MDPLFPITVVLADDHGIVRQCIAAYCRSRPEISIVGECADGEEAVRMIVAREPDFAILDLNMPKLGGLDIVRQVRLAKSRTRLIVLSITRDERLIQELFHAGADGYVLKDGPSRHLLDAMRHIGDGVQYLTPSLRREALPARRAIDPSGATQKASETGDPIALLSKREYEVFSFLAEGMRPKNIAKLLDISPKTVDTYRSNIVRKLEVDGIAGLVRFAIRRNLD